MKEQTGTKGAFFTCTISKDGETKELRTIRARYAEDALQTFLSGRRHAYLSRRGLPTWLGTPVKCANDEFQSENDGFVIAARKLTKLLSDLGISAEAPAKYEAAEAGNADEERRLMRTIDRSLLTILKALEEL